MHERPPRPTPPRTLARFLLALGAALWLGCMGGHDPKPSAGELAMTECVEPRPEICTREYRPVCGESVEGSEKTYGNACEACGDLNIVRHHTGAC